MELAGLGRMLVVAGLLIAALGLALSLGDRIPLLGRLPGDIRVGGDRVTFYFPLATSILLSVLLTALLAAVGWLGRR